MKSKLTQYYSIIGKITDIINTSKTVEGCLSEVIKVLNTLCHVDCATVWYKDEKEQLHPYYAMCPKDMSGYRFSAGEGVVGKVFSSNEPVHYLQFDREKDEQVEKMYEGIKIVSYVCVPLENKSGVIGAVEFISSTTPFDEEETNILEMVSMIASIKIDDNEQFHQKWEEKEVLLSARGIKKSFKNGNFTTQVLKGVDLDVYKGEFIVLLGESGCGKSTFLNIIGGMDTADEGELKFENKDLSAATERDLTQYRRYNIGFIFQSYNLMPNLNVKENLDIIAELVKEPMDSLQALSLVKLKEKANSYPTQLSGGQQQRVSIARALVKNPTLILADEPTAALDYETSIEVLSTLEEVYKKGTTLVMVTHNEEIAKMANRVVKLRGGKVYQITINRHPVKATELVW